MASIAHVLLHITPMAYTHGLHEISDGAAMLDAMAPFTSTAPISTLVNTHANGDPAHTRGDVLVHSPADRTVFTGDILFVEREATARHEAGMSSWDAAQEIYAMTNGDLGERGRVAVNVETVYRTLEPGYRSPDVVELFRRMAILEGAQ